MTDLFVISIPQALGTRYVAVTRQAYAEIRNDPTAIHSVATEACLDVEGSARTWLSESAPAGMEAILRELDGDDREDDAE